MVLGKMLLFGWLLFSLFGVSESLSDVFGVFSSSYKRYNGMVEVKTIPTANDLTLVILQD